MFSKFKEYCKDTWRRTIEEVEIDSARRSRQRSEITARAKRRRTSSSYVQAQSVRQEPGPVNASTNFESTAKRRKVETGLKKQEFAGGNETTNRVLTNETVPDENNFINVRSGSHSITEVSNISTTVSQIVPTGRNLEALLFRRIRYLELKLQDANDMIERLRDSLSEQDDFIREMEFEASRIERDSGAEKTHDLLEMDQSMRSEPPTDLPIQVSSEPELIKAEKSHSQLASSPELNRSDSLELKTTRHNSISSEHDQSVVSDQQSLERSGSRDEDDDQIDQDDQEDKFDQMSPIELEQISAFIDRS
ncbi:uncharacterized protein V1516DRAFT_419439 [Lipomyces oligophaga]|uniref:uncharacterized protein n=1 Tax=Lipomyces oligophaga TaxID=45792 RepID=UPI0034CECC9F